YRCTYHERNLHHTLHDALPICNSEFNGKEPWRYQKEIGEMMGDFLRLRHRMIPYLYTMNHRAYAEDLPLILPMYYHYPEAEEARSEEHTSELQSRFDLVCRLLL